MKTRGNRIVNSLIVSIVLAMCYPNLAMAGWDAEVVDARVSDSSPNVGESITLYCKFKNLSTYDSGDHGYATFCMLIRVDNGQSTSTVREISGYPNGELEPYETDTFSASYTPTRTGTHRLICEIQNVDCSWRYDRKTVNFTPISCQNECVPIPEYRCEDNYTQFRCVFSSNGCYVEQGTTCVYGCNPLNGECLPYSNCATKRCYDDDVWCYDSHDARIRRHQDCGDDSTSYSSAYCQNGNAVRDETAVTRWCSGGQCQSSTTTTIKVLETCDCGCSGGSCQTCCECSSGQTQSASCGNCGTKTRACVNSCQWGSWGSCQGEGCASGSTETRICGSDVGECQEGEQSRTCSSSCQWGNWGACDDVGPTSEACDNRDNDCDGQTDEGAKRTCTNYSNCTTYQTCDSCPTPPAETCNNRDDDCDGATDEFLQQGCACLPCGEGTQECVFGTWTACSMECRNLDTTLAEILANPIPAPEECPDWGTITMTEECLNELKATNEEFEEEVEKDIAEAIEMLPEAIILWWSTASIYVCETCAPGVTWSGLVCLWSGGVGCLVAIPVVAVCGVFCLGPVLDAIGAVASPVWKWVFERAATRSVQKWIGRGWQRFAGGADDVISEFGSRTAFKSADGTAIIDEISIPSQTSGKMKSVVGRNLAIHFHGWNKYYAFEKELMAQNIQIIRDPLLIAEEHKFVVSLAKDDYLQGSFYYAFEKLGGGRITPQGALRTLNFVPTVSGRGITALGSNVPVENSISFAVRTIRQDFGEGASLELVESTLPHEIGELAADKIIAVTRSPISGVYYRMRPVGEKIEGAAEFFNDLRVMNRYDGAPLLSYKTLLGLKNQLRYDNNGALWLEAWKTGDYDGQYFLVYYYNIARKLGHNGLKERIELDLLAKLSELDEETAQILYQRFVELADEVWDDGAIYASEFPLNSQTATNGFDAILKKYRYVSSEVGNNPPVAQATYRITAEAEQGLNGELDGQESYDPDGDPLMFHWSQDPNNPQAIQLDESDPQPDFNLTQKGVYKFLLIVSDGFLESEPAEVEVPVDEDAGSEPPTEDTPPDDTPNPPESQPQPPSEEPLPEEPQNTQNPENQAPIVEIEATCEDNFKSEMEGFMGACTHESMLHCGKVYLDYTVSPLAEIQRWRIDWGDDFFGVSDFNNQEMEKRSNYWVYYYWKPGRYVITLTVTDNNGLSASGSTTVEVTEKDLESGGCSTTGHANSLLFLLLLFPLRKNKFAKR